jgi:hypothetical protein
MTFVALPGAGIVALHVRCRRLDRLVVLALRAAAARSPPVILGPFHQQVVYAPYPQDWDNEIRPAR